MKLLVLYRANSEHSRSVEEFIGYFKQRDSQTEVELLDVDSVAGSSQAALYDVVQYPAILALQTDGSLQKLWQGEQLPLVDEVESYVVA